MGKRVVGILLLLTCLLLSCGSQKPLASGPTVVEPTATRRALPTPRPTPTSFPRPIHSATPFPTAWPTFTPLPTVLRTPVPGCPALGNPPTPLVPAKLTRVAEFAGVLQAYLDAGASIEALDQLMREWAHLTSLEGVYGGHMAWSEDLTGDGLPETIAVAYRASPTSPKRGDLLIWQCRDGKMELLFSAAAAIAFSEQESWGAYYHVLQVGDLNRDGQPEVLFNSVRLAGNYGEKRLYAIEWDGTAFVQRAPGFPEMPDTRYTLSDQGVIADSGTIASVGAGVWRHYEQHWTWQGQVLTMTKEVFGPPTARIQYLYDGDDALMRGDVATATVDYQEAISRTDLDTGLIHATDKALAAFARFKLMVAYAVAEDDVNLEAAYQQLQASTPETSIGRIYVAMAQSFWEAHQAGQGVEDACAAAIAVAADDDSAVDLLYAGYAKFAGYASTRYERPGDLCRVPCGGPCISPSTSQGLILYESSSGHDRAIWQMSGDGSGKHIVAPVNAGKGSGTFPRWSPDGQHFAYLESFEEEGTHWQVLWVAERDGGTLRPITDRSRGIWYRWRDGNTLVFTGSAPAPGTSHAPASPSSLNFVYSLVTGESTTLDFPSSYDEYSEYLCSSNCERAATVKKGSGDYTILNPRTGESVTVFSAPEGEILGEGGGSAWSPTEDRVAFTHCYWQEREKVEFCDLYTVRRDGQDLQQLTHLESQYKGRGSVTNVGNAQWSPDGQWLAVILGIDGEGLSYFGVIPSSGGRVTNLGIAGRYLAEPVWSPDSSRIAFITNARLVGGHFPDQYDDLGQWDIYSINVNTREISQLTDDAAMEMYIDWK